MSSIFDVESDLLNVTIDNSYATNRQPKTKSNSILHAAKVLLQLVSLVFCLYLIIFLIMTGFSSIGTVPEDIAQSSVTTTPKSVQSQSPKRAPMSESFLNSLRIRAEDIFVRLFVNKTRSEQFCLPPTSLANCELDWHKLKLYIGMDSRIGILDQSYAKPSHRKDQRFITAEEITCFGPFNGTHSEVRLDKFGFKHQNGIHKFDYTRVIIYARHIVPIDPYRYILVTGDMALQFCWFSLLGHGGTCPTYER